MNTPAKFRFTLISLLLPLIAATACAKAENTGDTPQPAVNKAVVPVNKLTNKNWSGRHTQFLAQAKKGGIDLLFIGDSLTANWEKNPAVWNKFFGKSKAANIGIGGDQTEHLLWRLRSGEIDGLSPKVSVLLIGANNMSIKLKYTPAQIAEGVAADIAEIRKRMPATKVLLVSIPPRVTPMAEWLNQKNMDVNKLLPALCDGENIIYIDIWKNFLGPDGETDKTFYQDSTHFNEKGYTRYAEIIKPIIDKYMKP